jgi:hypothetical protein
VRQEGWDGDSSLGVAEGEPKRKEETKACEQSRHVHGSSGVDKTRGGTGVHRGLGSRGKEVGLAQHRKRVVALVISNPQQFCAATGEPGGGSLKSRRSASKQRKSVER